MNQYNFRNHLLEFKKQVNGFKGKKRLEIAINERLDKSFKSYCDSLNELSNFLMKRNPRISLNKLKD